METIVKILFIDDNDVDTFNTIKRFLSEEPLFMIPSVSVMPIRFEFLWLRTSAEAIEKVNGLPKNAHIILVVDFYFKGEKINGMQLAAQLFALREDLPFVFMSSQDNEEISRYAAHLSNKLVYEHSQKMIGKFAFRSLIIKVLLAQIKGRTIKWQGVEYHVRDILCVTTEWKGYENIRNIVYLVLANGTVTPHRATLKSFSEAVESVSFNLLANFPQVNRKTIVNRLYCEKHENPQEKQNFYLKTTTGQRTPIECSEGQVLPV